MDKKAKRTIRAATACVILLASLPAAGQQAGIECEIAAVETRMAVAMGSHLDLIAPEAFAEAQGDLAEARKRFENGDGIIRLSGPSFPIGSSLIQPEDFRLLTRLQSALRMFPGTPVTIEGHSDSVGDDQYNQALSLMQAEAVRSYLAANLAGDDARLQAAGFGATVPLVSNETTAGRARNRRIDVRIATAVR